MSQEFPYNTNKALPKSATATGFPKQHAPRIALKKPPNTAHVPHRYKVCENSKILSALIEAFEASSLSMDPQTLMEIYSKSPRSNDAEHYIDMLDRYARRLVGDSFPSDSNSPAMLEDLLCFGLGGIPEELSGEDGPSKDHVCFFMALTTGPAILDWTDRLDKLEERHPGSAAWILETLSKAVIPLLEPRRFKEEFISPNFWYGEMDEEMWEMECDGEECMIRSGDWHALMPEWLFSKPLKPNVKDDPVFQLVEAMDRKGALYYPSQLFQMQEQFRTDWYEWSPAWIIEYKPKERQHLMCELIDNHYEGLGHEVTDVVWLHYNHVDDAKGIKKSVNYAKQTIEFYYMFHQLNLMMAGNLEEFTNEN